MVNQEIGNDCGKRIKGRFRFVSVDTLGLVLRVWVGAANVGERSGGKRVLKRVKKMDKAVSRLHTLWTDGGNECEPFMQWVMNVCRWTRAGGAATRTDAHVSCCSKNGGWWSARSVA